MLEKTITHTLAERLSREHVALTSSGSSALITALKATEIPLGSEVIMPAICCPAVLFAIQMAGYTPVLADVDLNSFSSNLAQIRPQVTANTKAVVAVHGYGIACDIAAIEQYCQQENLVLIEDACLALGGKTNQAVLGSFGDISIISFGYDKTIAQHYGGAIFTNDKLLAANMQQTLSVNQFFCYQDDNQKLHALQQALTQLDSYTQQRAEKAIYCHENLQSQYLTKPDFELGQPLWRYPALFDGDRESLVTEASSQDIIITCHYKSLELLKTGWHLQNAQQVSEQVINLFVRPEMPMSALKKTINFINEFS